jgi:hypothetical protein
MPGGCSVVHRRTVGPRCSTGKDAEQKKETGGVGEVPVDVLFAGEHGARVAAAHRHDEVRPFDVVAGEPRTDLAEVERRVRAAV